MTTDNKTTMMDKALWAVRCGYGMSVWVEDVAEKTGMTYNQAYRALNRLQNMGKISGSLDINGKAFYEAYDRND